MRQTTRKATTTSSKIEFFEEYVRIGWQPIPLRPGTKLPINDRWNQGYDPDEARSFFRNGNYNMGLRLGDVIDVEADTPGANLALNQMIGDYPHPVYRSAKSLHHLFQCPDRSLTRVVLHGIEFRGRLHQSVLPPSQVGGVRYGWIDISPVPPMPTRLLKFYWGDSKKRSANPRCSVCGKGKFVEPRIYRREVQAFHLLGVRWRCKKCRNCLGGEVKRLCRTIKRG